MKARLPYFLLALLTGSCFFPGSVKANRSPTDVEFCAKALHASVLDERHAERQFAVFPFLTETAFLPTDIRTGSEEAGAYAEPAEVAAPVVANPIPGQAATEGAAFSFAFAENTFSDADGDALSYTATLTDGSNLPAWLSFDGATRTFSGTPAAADVGVVNIRVTATDPGEESASTDFDLTINSANVAPTVNAGTDQTITLPTTTAHFTATAEDTDGTIATYAWETTASPEGSVVTLAGAETGTLDVTVDLEGTYTFAVTVTDNDGATASDQVSLTVNPEPAGNVAPEASITSPANGGSFPAPANITITADASDADGTVAQVEFFQGTTSLGIDTDGADGWSTSWADVAGGSYILTAIATDNLGAPTTSAGVNIEVEGPNTDPVVSITSPADGATFTAAAHITITADASDPDADGTIAKVEFFEGATKLGEDFTSPYSFTWSGVAAGTYALTVIATDNLGATTISSVVNITVSDPLGTPVSIVPGSTCGPGTVTLSAEPGSGGDAVRWYDSSVDGTPLDTTATGESYTTEVITVTTSYWISTYNTTTLEESDRVEIVATVKNVPSAPTVSVVNNCNGTSNLTASAYEGTLLWSTGETTASITVTTAGEYTVTQTVDGCISAAGAGTAAPKTKPSAPTVEAQNFCSSDNPTVADLPQGEGSYTWYGSLEATEGLPSTEPLSTGTYYVTTTVDGCESDKATVSVEVDPTSVGGTIAGSATVCSAGNSGTLILSGETGDVIRWESSTDNGTNWNIISNTTNSQDYLNLTDTTQYRAVVQSGTCGEVFSAIATIRVNQTPAAPTVTVIDNCDETSTLIASNYTGSLLWSTGETTENITVTTAGEYTVTQTVDGCTSAAGAGTAAPKSPPAEPEITNIRESLTYYTGEGQVTLEGSGIDPATNGEFTLDGVAFNGTFDPCTEGVGTKTLRYTYTDPDTQCSNFIEYTITIQESKYTVIITSNPFPPCKGDHTDFTAHVYRDVEEVIYPYLVNEKGQPVDEENNLIGDREMLVPNPDYPFPADTPPLVIANAWRFFKPIIIMGDGEQVNTTDDDRQQSNKFNYKWTKNDSNPNNGISRNSRFFNQAGLSSTDWYAVEVTPKNGSTACPEMPKTLSNRLFLGAPDNYTITLNPVAAWCNDGSGDAAIILNAVAGDLPGGWAGSELVLNWYLEREGVSTLLEQTTYAEDGSHLSITLPKSTFQNGDKVYIDFETNYDDFQGINSKCVVESISPTITIAIDEPAALTADLGPASEERCVGDEVTYSVNATGTSLEFSWYKDGTELSNVTDEIIIENTATGSSLTLLNLAESDEGIYYMVVSNSTESVCAASQQSANAALIINPLPTVSVEDQSTCEGTPVTITATAGGGSSPYTYSWTVPEGVTNPGNASSFETTVAGTYTVTLTDEKACQSALAESVVTVNAVTLVSEAALEVTWITEGTEWEVKAVEEVPGEFGENPVFTWYKRVYPSEEWGDPIQVGPDSIYIERAPHEDLEFKVELMNSATCTRYELTNIGVTAQPVEMIYFRAEEQGEDVRLSWATATEKYNTGFEVQLSTDGQTFRKLAFVETLNGNSVETQEYTYIDREPAKQGTRYYRLQQIDVDGTTAYFGPLVVALRNTGPVKVYPNPFLDRLRLSIESEKAGQALLSVANNTGTVVLKQSLLLEKGTNSAEILLDPHLPAGIYLLSTRVGGKTRHFKLFKQ